MKILSCTEASKLLNSTKEQVRNLVDQKRLRNYGNNFRYMVLESDVLEIKKNHE